ncbi:MAG TPA: aspartate-semialdehyde dehydrogenase [Candidatus Kapabacteria bacterium]|nr:aspartate-semialdehyde dehydrogenase [Candidatus Kapabacteria bacterium]
MSTTIRLGVVGATGAVGSEIFKILAERNFPFASLRAFASERSAGKIITFKNTEIVIEATNESVFADLDIALFSAGSSITKQYREAAKKAGCLIIDNSSAYRMDTDVPLVVPDVNDEDCKDHQGLIAVPNCSAIMMLMAVAPINKVAPIRRIVVSTYQAVSGAGAKALAELQLQIKELAAGRQPTIKEFPYQIALNLFSHNTPINEVGYNGEEWKVIHESQKILHNENIAITATCVRVPVERAHSESVNMEFIGERPSVDEIRSIISNANGVILMDDQENNHFPMPLEAAGKDNVYVGRIRNDISNPKAIDLFVSGDQLRQGAALTAVRIAEYVIKNNLI